MVKKSDKDQWRSVFLRTETINKLVDLKYKHRFRSLNRVVEFLLDPKKKSARKKSTS